MQENTATKTTSTNQEDSKYINNPFTIALEGIKLLFKNTRAIAILLVILSIINALTYRTNPYNETTEPAAPLTLPSLEIGTVIAIAIIVIIIALGVVTLGAFFIGIFSFTSAELAKGNTVSLRRAIKTVYSQLWSFLWLQILMLIKVLLWSLLFIIPGIVMAIRYSLANVSFFDSNKKLRGNAAIKDSIVLTKNNFKTTFATQSLFSVITIGLISPIVDVASKAMLYRQLTSLQLTEDNKLKTHILSQIMFGLLVAGMILLVLGIFFLIWGIVNYVDNQTISETPTAPFMQRD